MPLSWRQMVMDSGSSCQVPRDQRLMGRLVGGLSHLSDPVWGKVSADGGGTAVQVNSHTEISQPQEIAGVFFIVLKAGLPSWAGTLLSSSL